MLCKEVRSSLFQYLDGELPQERQSDMEGHLASCADCCHLVDLERTFRHTYLDALRPDPVPARVREHVIGLLGALPDHQPGRNWRRFASPPMPLLAAAALLVVGGILGVGLQRLWNGTRPPLNRLAEASVEQHQKLVRGIVPYDIKQVPAKAAEQWFRRRLDFNVSLPELTRQGLTFIGGRISHLRDFDVAALHYQVEGKDVSLFIIPLDQYRGLGLGESPKFKMVAHQGYDVIVWASHGAAYSLVSEIGGQSCLVCHSPEEKLDLPSASRVHDKM